MDLQTPLPENLINQILLRFPLKSLARFKCVSKHWEDVISHHRFTKTRTLLYLRETDDVGRFRHCYDIVDERFVGNIKPQYFPSDQLRLEGTYNGLICFSNGITGDACVWNPLLNQWRPCDFKSRFYNRYASFGLGFDAVNDDYKVVRISTDQDGSLVIEICQLKNTETRVIVLPSDEVPFKLSDLTPVTVNGSSHWIAYHPKKNCFQIVRFDMDREIFLEIPFSEDMPNVDCGHYTELDVETRAFYGRNIDDQQFSLGVYKGSLCVFVITLGNLVDAWSMNYKNHDHSDSVWTTIFEAVLNRKINTVSGFTSDDKIVLTSDTFGDFFYDPWKEQYIVPPRQHHLQIQKAVSYVESLVSVQPHE